MGYRWPLTQIRITQPFGPEPGASWIVDGKPFHDGLDVATFCGYHVYATHDGTVLAAGRSYDDFMGWVGDLAAYDDRLTTQNLWGTLPIVVVMDDGDGYRSTYAHFSKVVVKPGEAVKAGTLLGYEGRTGNATGCHVHYGLFSPAETRTFAFDPSLAAKMLLPDREIARVDPLRALPALPRTAGPPSPRPWGPALAR